jgi:uncharacterized protein (TIGR02246 family)
MSNPDEQALIDATIAFGLVWNQGDAAAAAEFFAEDGTRVGAFGDVQHGRAEIQAAYERLMHQSMAGAALQQERGQVRWLTPDLAVWQAGLELTPASGPRLKGHVVQVMQKIGGRWLILEAHPKFFPPPSRAA